MSDIRLDRDGSVFVLRLGDGENRFDRAFVDTMTKALDTVDGAAGAALVTVGDGKIWSNGLDLEWMGSSGAGSDFVADVQRLMARVLVLGVPTVAALNGHAFAAGAMLALAHDVRVMRADRGFFCLPEVDVGLPFTPGMAALIRAKLPAGSALRELAVYGRRIGGADAAARGIVDEAAGEAEVLPRAVALATGLAGKDRATLSAIKRGLFADVAAALGGG